VGLDSPDDAAVWRLDDQRAIVVTTDFFTPVVDTPYEYGAIAAANSLSDVYAMGGHPFLALNVAAIPPDLPPEYVAEIIRGGAVKALEAGVVIAGGHTVQDKEPKYGLVVIGFVHPERMLTKRGARPGDRLVLTKPLGFGVTTTALKQEKAAEEHIAEVVEWMMRLNRGAAALAAEFELQSATDITGFSLLGHAWEMAAASRVGMRIVFERIPFVSGARRYASEWLFPGGAADNSHYFSGHVRFNPHLTEVERMLLFDPQTSGGLLLAVAPDKLSAFLERAVALQQPAWEIGEVVAGSQLEVV
ncbi:MAG: selenide, water dikinase SelD, partial [Anaerolineaceae bacterium]|nr:selenide, water dikinase SelD [Anaerolineaceae bacterium]